MEKWDFEVQKRDSSRWYMEHPHFHEGFEILLPLTCGGSIFIDRRAWPLNRGLLFLIDAAAPHRSFSQQSTSYSRYVLHFSRETLAAQRAGVLAEKLSTGSQCIALSPEGFAQCVALFQEMEQPGIDTAAWLHRRAAFLRMLAMACELWVEEPVYLPPQNPADTAAAAAITYIRNNLERPLSLDELASECFMSKSTLCHRFKEATGFSVGEYIIHCRVLRARTLLRRGALVQEAGERAGFGDNAHFIRTFKRLTGTSPGQYAKNCRAEAISGGRIHE